MGVRGAFFGEGIGTILGNYFLCSGNEATLLDCYFESNDFCSHSDDAGVICPTNQTLNCTTGDVRLVGGENQYEGRVEICLHGRWGTVCDDFWDGYDAAVVCRQLGYTENGFPYAISNALFGLGGGFILLDSVACLGNETSLLSCLARNPGDHNCSPFEDAGVFCPCEDE